MRSGDPRGLILLAAGAGVARWFVMALNPDFPVTFMPQLLNAVSAIAPLLAISLVLGRERSAPARVPGSEPEAA